MANLEDYLTTAEVADELGVNIKTVQRLGALGHIRCIKFPGRTGPFMFDPEAVRLYKEQGRDADRSIVADRRSAA